MFSKERRKRFRLQPPSKEEKLETVKKIASDIFKWDKGKAVEVVFLDESHFSTDPYVIRGWHECGELGLHFQNAITFHISS